MKGTRTLICLLALFLLTGADAAVRIVLRIAPGANPATVARRHALTYLDNTHPAPFILVRAQSVIDANRAAITMRADRQIVWFEYDDDGLEIPGGTDQAGKGSTIAAVGGRTEVYARNANLLRQIGFSPALAQSSGRSVRIAVLDTGLSPRQTALWSRVVAATNCIELGLPAYDLPRNTDTDRNGVRDQATGHGTMVTALVDAVAPRCSLVIARVADSDGHATAWSLIRGITFALRAGAEVINISLGALNSPLAVGDVIDWASEENGATVVAAIGNDGVNRARYPARTSKVISVAGLLPDSRKAPFSNWDSDTAACAPATGITSQWWSGRMAVWSGTSFATPLVAGTIADCLRRSGRRHPEFVAQSLFDSGVTVDPLNPAFRGKLGRRLHHVRLDQFLRRTPDP